MVTTIAPDDRRGLDQRQLHVAGPRRQVDHQVIQFAPIHAAQELLDHAVQHRAAPHQRLVAGIQEAHRHELDAVLFERLDAIAERHRRLVDAHHERHVGTVNVGVQQADLVAQRARAIARFTETVVLPTPPLPDPTAIRFLTPGIGSLGIWPG